LPIASPNVAPYAASVADGTLAGMANGFAVYKVSQLVSHVAIKLAPTPVADDTAAMNCVVLRPPKLVMKPEVPPKFTPTERESRIGRENGRQRQVERRRSDVLSPYRRVEKIDMSDLPPKYDPTGLSTRRSEEETNDPIIAYHRNFYKVEKWTKDGTKVERMIYAGSSLDKAREVFAAAIYNRPRIRLTIRQRTHVLLPIDQVFRTVRLPMSREKDLPPCISDSFLHRSYPASAVVSG
jgi:hypothetical protein